MLNVITILKALGTTALLCLVFACATLNKDPGLTWKARISGGCAPGSSAASLPVMSNGIVYLGSSDGAVYAVIVNSGAQLWRFQTGAGLPSGTEIIVAPSGSGAGDLPGGSLESQETDKPPGKRQISAPVITDGTNVYVGSWDHGFYALDAMTGLLKWRFHAGLPIMQQAVLTDGKVIFTTGGRQAQNDWGDGLVYALDASTGKKAWEFDTLAGVESNAKWPPNLPVVKDGVVFVTNWNAARYERGAADTAFTNTFAIDVATGDVIWKHRSNAAWPSAPVVTENFVLFTSSPRTNHDAIILHVLDRTTGKEMWKYTAVGGKEFWKLDGIQTPMVAREKIAMLATDKFIVGLDLRNGHELWRLAEPFQKKPANRVYLGPLLYVITGDTLAPTQGSLYAIDVETGVPAWSMPMYSRNNIRAVTDDVIYIATEFLRTALITVDGVSGEELGTAWSLAIGMFRNESTIICSGPVRYGNRLFLSTRDEIYAGQGSSSGFLYSFEARKRRIQ